MKAIIVLLALCFSLSVFSQDPKFTWGIAVPKTGKQQSLTMFGAGQSTCFVVSKNAAEPGQFSARWYLEGFNARHDRIFSNDITPQPIYDVAGTAYVGGKVVLFHYGFEKDKMKDILYVTSYGSDGRADAPKELVSHPAEKMANRGRYHISQSPDRQKLLIAYEPDFRKGENEQVQLTLMDDQYQVKWQRMQTLPFEWKRGVNNEYLLNNPGVAFIVKDMVVKGEEGHYAALAFDGSKLFNHSLEPGEGKKVVALRTTVSNDGTPVIAGYYTEDKKVRVGSTNFNGSFVFRLAADGSQVSGAHTNAFEEKRKDLQLRYLFVQDGATYLMGQREAVRSSLSEDKQKAMKGEYDYTYYSGDIYIDAIGPTGKAAFSRTINRNLDSKNDFGTSNGFFAAIKGEKIYIIFNDEESRFDGKKIIITFYDPLLPVMVTVHTGNGQASPLQPLYNSGGVGGKKAEMRMRPDAMMKIDDSHYILRGENNQLFKMGMVELL